jgi:hypothetical protein
MTMTRKHPDYHKMMLDPATHPTATRRVKYDETRFSHLYKTGSGVFKIRKTSATHSSLAIKEVYAQEAFQLGKRWAPTTYRAVVAITQQDGQFVLGGSGAPVDYAVRMAQLPDHYFVDYLATHEKLNPTALGRVARFLAVTHAEWPASDAQRADIGRPDYFAELVEEVFYQVKKYFGVGLTEAMYELIARPMAHFLEHHRKVFLRRQNKSRVVQVHGAFFPQHVFVKQQELEAISPLETPRKLRVLDAASDVAQFVNGLHLLGAAEEADGFAKRYAAAAKDRDLERILPAYRIYQAAREGLMCCEWSAELPAADEQRERIRDDALRLFALAVDVARTLPK